MGLGQGPAAISLPGLHEICSPPVQCPLWEVMQLEGGPWDEIIAEKTDGLLYNPPLLSVPKNPFVWPQGQERALFHREGNLWFDCFSFTAPSKLECIPC